MVELPLGGVAAHLRGAWFLPVLPSLQPLHEVGSCTRVRTLTPSMMRLEAEARLLPACPRARWKCSAGRTAARVDCALDEIVALARMRGARDVMVSGNVVGVG